MMHGVYSVIVHGMVAVGPVAGPLAHIGVVRFLYVLFSGVETSSNKFILNH